jgi:hypothetical protein
MFSIGPLEHKNEYGFRQENSPFKKKHLKFPKISLFIFTHIMYMPFTMFWHKGIRHKLAVKLSVELGYVFLSLRL